MVAQSWLAQGCSYRYSQVMVQLQFFHYNSSPVSVNTQVLHYQPPQMFGLALASQAIYLKPSFRQPSEPAHKSQNHRLDWAVSDLRDHLVSTPFFGQEHLSLDQIALGQDKGPLSTLSFPSPTSDGTLVLNITANWAVRVWGSTLTPRPAELQSFIC